MREGNKNRTDVEVDVKPQSESLKNPDYKLLRL